MTSDERSGRDQRALRALAQGDYRVALTHAMQAVRADPSRVTMLLCAAESLVRLGDERAGLTLFKRAVETSPFNVEALAGAASTLNMVGRPDEALELADRALGLDPDALRPAQVRSAVLRAGGRAGEAARFFEPYFRAAPTDPGAVREWADLCRATDRHGAGVEAIEHALRLATPPPAARRELHYRLAHLLDELDRHDDAFAAVRLANDGPTRDAVVPADTIARMWPPGALGAVPLPEPRAPTPVLVVGMPRSGTTLVARLLAAHPRLATAGESPMLGAIARELRQLTHAPDRAWSQAQHDRYTAMLREAGPDAHAVVDKMPGNFMNLGVASRVLPNARVIHCRRDPRDVALSCYFQPFSEALEFTRDLVQCARQCVEKDRLMAHWSATTGLAIHEVAYERLVHDPDAAVRAMLDFIGVGFDPACLSPESARAHETTASWSRVSRPITDARVGRWRPYARHLRPMLDWLDAQAERPAAPATIPARAPAPEPPS